jgi:hypothetical protein
MMLSSLVGVSGPTFFINSSGRSNMGKIDPSKPH